MTTEVAQKIENYFSQYPSRSYPQGQIIIHAKENPEHIYYLVKGKVRQYDISYRGDEVIVNVFKPGAFFPMLWALTKQQNNYFFDTETAVEVRVAPVKETITFLQENPDILLDLLTRVYSGLDGILGRMVHLMSGSAQSRLLYELVVESRRFGEKSPDGSTLIAINEGDLAARAGLSRETISREMQKIAKDNLARLERGSIRIPDHEALEQKLARSV